MKKLSRNPKPINGMEFATPTKIRYNVKSQTFNSFRNLLSIKFLIFGGGTDSTKEKKVIRHMHVIK